MSLRTSEAFLESCLSQKGCRAATKVVSGTRQKSLTPLRPHTLRTPRDMAPSRELQGIQEPEPLQKLLDEDQKDLWKSDCLSCRVMGTGALIGLGGYTYWSGSKQLSEERAKLMKSIGEQKSLKYNKAQAIENSKALFSLGLRSVGLTGLSLTFVGCGIYRWVN